MSLTVGSLFSGVGGIDLGLEIAGMEIGWQVEIDPFCSKVLEIHWPEVERFGDIRELEELPRADLICAGFPCQDISVAGRGAGLSGSRSGLWIEAMRAVRMVRPRFVLLENVAALRNRGLSVILGVLAESGYDSEWDCLPASAFGAPHRRDRIFIIAYSTGGIFSSKQECQREMLGRSKESLGDGGVGQVAYATDSISNPLWQQHGWGGGQGGQGEAEPGNDGTIGDTSDSEGIRRIWRTVLSETSFQARRFRPEGDNPWSSEPPVCGVAYGVPNRSHRLKALGNAVLPQVAEYLGRCILGVEAEQETTA